ncbi:hypothetical protein DESC_30004 [Desulfosarcina cetonica]|nr:hypothetical protein DESC_30004 [Desulfosarcina cetonica]
MFLTFIYHQIDLTHPSNGDERKHDNPAKPQTPCHRGIDDRLGHSGDFISGLRECGTKRNGPDLFHRPVYRRGHLWRLSLGYFRPMGTVNPPPFAYGHGLSGGFGFPA